MELTISKKEKNKAQRNRIHKEKKWRPFKMVYHFSFLIAICSLVYGVLIVTSTNYINFDKCAIVFASTFVIGIVFRALTLNFTRHWIHSRINEKMWIENDVLNHFFQISWGSGWNSRSVDNTGYLFEIDLNSVNQVFFDKETKSSISIQKFGDVEITQFLRFVNGFTDKYKDMVEISYEVKKHRKLLHSLCFLSLTM